MARSALLPGGPAEIGGYRLAARLGEGGQGTVYQPAPAHQATGGTHPGGKDGPVNAATNALGTAVADAIISA
ncbi:MAG TPA: hypothetical protein VGL93_15380 [Streptosporangiaceae bacterium]|jgi:hypothetical protein